MNELSLNTNAGWQENFTYDYFKKILQFIKPNFNTCLFSEFPNIKKTDTPLLLLRHDIDLDLDKALVMAQIEQSLGVSSTYMVMINSPMYDLNEQETKLKIRKLISGHEIGLHFDSSSKGTTEEQIDEACNILKSASNSHIKSISFHRPVQEFLRGPKMINNLVNAYSKELMQKYISDSKGVFREGEPIANIKNSNAELIQLLIHPIWWAESHTKPEESLQVFFEKRTNDKPKEFINKFDSLLSNHLSIKRKGAIQ